MTESSPHSQPWESGRSDSLTCLSWAFGVPLVTVIGPRHQEYGPADGPQRDRWALAVPVRWTRLRLLSRGHRGRGLFDAGGHSGRLRHVDRVTGGHLDSGRASSAGHGALG